MGEAPGRQEGLHLLVDETGCMLGIESVDEIHEPCIRTQQHTMTVLRNGFHQGPDCMFRVRSFTAALLAPYTVWPGTGKKPPILETLATGRF